MSKKRILDILIPQYKETDEKLEKMFNSLLAQELKGFTWDDVGVIIVNDGSDVRLSKELLTRYPFKIEYYLEEHRGVSGTRDACFNHSQADYVMWCDADDLFCDVCGLYTIFGNINGFGRATFFDKNATYYTIEKNQMVKATRKPTINTFKKKPYFIKGFDALVSCFREESHPPQLNGGVMYIPRGLMTTVPGPNGQPQTQGSMDMTFVHGKVYRRQYLLDNKIRWNQALTIHEDSYFNCLAIRSTPYLKYIAQPFYLWKWYDESVCRHDPKYILKTFNNLLDSNSALIREFMSRKREDQACFFATSMIFDAYMTLNKDEWINQENQEYREAVEKRFKVYYKEFRTLFEKLYKSENPQDKMVMNQIYMGQKNRFSREGMVMEQITFKDWISQVEKEIEKETD